MYALTKSVFLILFCFSLFGCDAGLSAGSAKQQLESYLESEKNPLSDSIKAGAYEFCPAPMLAVNGQKTLTIDTIENGVYKKLKSSGYITTELKRQYGLAPTMYVYDIKETNLLAPLIVDRKKQGLLPTTVISLNYRLPILEISKSPEWPRKTRTHILSNSNIMKF